MKGDGFIEDNKNVHFDTSFFVFVKLNYELNIY